MRQPDEAVTVIDRATLCRTLRLRQHHAVFQPLHSLATGAVVGVECLTRFSRSARPTIDWFQAAHAHGLGTRVELAAAHDALGAAAGRPDDMVAWVNLSPSVVMDPGTPGLLESSLGKRVGIQVTGTVAGRQLDDLRAVCWSLQRKGAQVSVDADLALSLSRARDRAFIPDQVRSGRDLTAALGSRRGTARARRLVALVRRMGATVVAEGIESPQQLLAWTRLGADEAQGHLLAEPGPLRGALRAHPIAGRTLEPAGRFVA